VEEKFGFSGGARRLELEMKRLTASAHLVFEAVQKAREPDSDFVDTGRALIAILEADMGHSAMARALADDQVWPMRQQVLQSASGKPQYGYLPKYSNTAFRPALLLEKAENLSNSERAAFVFERHIAQALASDNALASLGVNGPNLVDRVRVLEGAIVEPLCFVLMPFQRNLDRVYEAAIKPAAEKAKLRCERADEITAPGVILEQIDERIQRAQIIIADLTGSNSNVAQELGYARALQKPFVLLMEEHDISRLPFDVRHYRVLKYSLDAPGQKDLSDRLSLALGETLGINRL
jgi:nucleoside 2-deoxyribosyltransferase